MRILKTTCSRVLHDLRLMENQIIVLAGTMRTSGLKKSYPSWRKEYNEAEWRGTFLIRIKEDKFLLCNIKGEVQYELEYTNSVTTRDTLIFAHTWNLKAA